MLSFAFFFAFLFNYTPTPEIYTYLHTLSLHDALPILRNPRTLEMKLKNQAAWVFRKSTKSLIQPPSGILCCSRKSMAKARPSSPVAVPQRRTARPSGPARPPYTLTGRKVQAELRLHRRHPVLAVDGLHAGQPAVDPAAVGLQPLRLRHLPVLPDLQQGPQQ